MSDIAAFIAARLGEDEAVIKVMDSPDAARDVVGLWSSNLGQETYVTRYLAQFDPARALRGVEADRRLIAAYEAAREGGIVWDVLGFAAGIRAAIWADHPDYDPAWKPETAEGPPA